MEKFKSISVYDCWLSPSYIYVSHEDKGYTRKYNFPAFIAFAIVLLISQNKKKWPLQTVGHLVQKSDIN